VGLRRLISLPTLVAAIVLGTVLVGVLDASSETSDLGQFARAGGVLLSRHALHTYAGEEVQAGPLELALAGGMHAVSGGQTGLAILIDLFCTAIVFAAAYVLLDRRTSQLALFTVGAFALWLPGTGYNGHPAEPLIAVLWLFAAREARRGRTTVAGVLVGLSGCLELWGVLGVTALALAPQLRRCVSGVVLAGVLPAAALLPFVLGGDFHMFQLTWPIERGLPLLLFGSGGTFTWPMRLGEAVIVVLAGGSVARATRRYELSIWLVPAVTALVRIACDPVDYGYYWATPLVILLIGAVQLIARRHQLAAWMTARLRPASSS
jgi:hypothetical protein